MSINKRALLAALPVGILSYVAVAFIADRLVLRAVEVATVSPAILESDPRARIAGPILQIEPIVRLHVPQELHGSDGARLSVSVGKTLLGHGDEFPGSDRFASDQPPTWDTSEVDKPFAVKVVPSSGLGVRPSSIPPKSFAAPRSMDDPPLTWNWSLAAKAAGHHTLLIEGLPLKNKLVRLVLSSGKRESLPRHVQLLEDGTLEIHIRALTALGLTAGQDAMLGALNGLAGFFGVVLAYPFIKRRLERSQASRGDTERRLELKVHRAYFVGDSTEMYFINLTNLSPGRVLEVTHVWYEDETHHVPIIRAARPLPIRLDLDESWETWIPVQNIPGHERRDACRHFRARITTGDVFVSEENPDVPPVGQVPGSNRH